MVPFDMSSMLWMQLRQQFVTVDGLVDDVVATYHNGFNKAIHNYSHILQLFADTKAQVRGGISRRCLACTATAPTAVGSRHPCPQRLCAVSRWRQ
jgi:Sec8 exocyst complex component specific domain